MSGSDDMLGGTGAPEAAEEEAISRAFGEANRLRLIREYLGEAGEITAENAWQHVYRLLLWIDRTIGLAHCYESDKCQPGRPWYGRSLAFHGWIARALQTDPEGLVDEIDWLFKKASSDLAAVAPEVRARLAARQREQYEGQGFPEPGEDPELVEIILDGLGSWLDAQPPPDALLSLTERIHAYMTQENKRKNLVGEGFEDVLATVIRAVLDAEGRSDVEVRRRPFLHSLPGFYPPRADASGEKVDLTMVRRSDRRRWLPTAKWSFRADRERQFLPDFESYAAHESAGQGFDYVLITNEFDPARLNVKGQQNPRGSGHENCAVAAMRTAR